MDWRRYVKHFGFSNPNTNSAYTKYRALYEVIEAGGKDLEAEFFEKLKNKEEINESDTED